MPKKKTKKAFAKRCVVTSSGRIKFHRPGKSHLLGGKSRNQKRRLRRPKMADSSDLHRLRDLITT